GNSAQLEISCGLPGLHLGESIAVDGACLTVAKLEKTGFTADVSHESLDKTIIGKYNIGAAVNLEQALQLGDRLGGHFVAGHVDCAGKIGKIIKRSTDWDLAVHLGRSDLKYIVGKGSVAVNGISLTVAAKLRDGFTLVIVPHTLRTTTIANWRTGDAVNIEFDIIGKYVESYTTGKS
ncbi:MAG TPA: riboflavin synthase, partial [Candidatus Edwardsbacteria bacterium]|nr:riboflavin synthase [Candidatus Edwardsbacteria bacterium]